MAGNDKIKLCKRRINIESYYQITYLINVEYFTIFIFAAEWNFFVNAKTSGILPQTQSGLREAYNTICTVSKKLKHFL